MTDLILELVLTAIAILISKYLIPWLKEKRLLSAAKITVEAVEQIFTGTKAGQEKFEQAKTWLLEKFNLTEEEAKKLIEAAVYNMNKEKGKL